MKSRIHSFILSNVSLRAGATLKTLGAAGREDLGPYVWFLGNNINKTTPGKA